MKSVYLVFIRITEKSRKGKSEADVKVIVSSAVSEASGETQTVKYQTNAGVSHVGE